MVCLDRKVFFSVGSLLSRGFFSTCISWWFSTRFWRSLLKSPELFLVFWPSSLIVNTCIFIPQSSSPFSYLLWINIITIYTQLFSFSIVYFEKSWYLPLFPFSFNFTLWTAWTANPTIQHVVFLFVDYQLI